VDDAGNHSTPPMISNIPAKIARPVPRKLTSWLMALLRPFCACSRLLCAQAVVFHAVGVRQGAYSAGRLAAADGPQDPGW
jgi:hypothetical protein